MGHKMKKSPDKPMMAVLALMALYAVWYYPGYYPFPQLSSAAVAWLLGLAGMNAVAIGQQMVVDFGAVSRTITVSADCSGFLIMMVFLVTVFVSPGFRRRQKLMALLIVPIILAGNMFRIFAAIMLGYGYGVGVMVVFHNTLGNVFMFILATLAYFLWLYVVGQRRPPRIQAQY
jgi:exosortase/archaeosortase family protein